MLRSVFVFCGVIILIMEGDLHAQLELSWNGAFLFDAPAMFDIKEAGNDFPSTLYTVPNLFHLDLDKTNSAADPYPFPWLVEVRRLDYEWHGDLKLFLRRTGDGNHLYPGIRGGNTYLEVTQQGQFFFEGAGSHQQIPLQLMIKGISVKLPAQSYSTTLIFTLVEP